MAIDLGTTTADLARVADAPVVVPPKASAQPAQPKVSTSKPSISTSKPSTSTAGSGVTATDKNGNGIEDFLEGVYDDGTGTTEASPNFHPKAN